MNMPTVEVQYTFATMPKPMKRLIEIAQHILLAHDAGTCYIGTKTAEVFRDALNQCLIALLQEDSNINKLSLEELKNQLEAQARTTSYGDDLEAMAKSSLVKIRDILEEAGL